MDNFNALSSSELIVKTKALVQEERKINAQVIKHLKAIFERKIYLEKGFSSLFDFLVRELGYSEAAAGRRVQAVNLLCDVPEVEKKIEKGELSMSTATVLGRFFKQEKYKGGNDYSQSEKLKLIEEVQGLSHSQTEKTLAEKSSLQPSEQKPTSQKRALPSGGVLLTLRLTQAQYDKLEKMKDLMSHSVPDRDAALIFERLMDAYIIKKEEVRSEQTPTMRRDSASNHISANTRRKVMKTQGKCQYPNESGGVCGSRYRLQIDHIIPVAHGGKSTLENLRCLCQKHNLYAAEKMGLLRMPKNPQSAFTELLC